MRVMQWRAVSWLIWIIICVLTAFLDPCLLAIDNFFVLLNNLYHFWSFWTMPCLRNPLPLYLIFNFMSTAYLMTAPTLFHHSCWLLRHLFGLHPTFICRHLGSVIAMAVFKWFAVAYTLFSYLFLRWMMLEIVDFL